MATAKQQKVKVTNHATGKPLKVECAPCYDEFGSEACLRAAHGKMPNPYKVKVVQDFDEPVEKEVLASAIVQISEATKKLYKTGLNKKAVVALINDDTKLGKGLVETVLNSLETLAKKYTK